MYQQYDGVRNYCGHELPEGMVKNPKLWELFLTPTTKEEDHDRPISGTEIVLEWMATKHFDVCAKAALEVLAFDRKLVGRERSYSCRYKV